jgi:hypothetical protein
LDHQGVGRRVSQTHYGSAWVGDGWSAWELFRVFVALSIAAMAVIVAAIAVAPWSDGK